MKLKMLETFQGRDVTAVHSIDQIVVGILENGEEYEVGETLGAWLLANNKAEKVVTPNVTPVTPDVTPDEAPTEPVPAQPKKRGRKS